MNFRSCIFQGICQFYPSYKYLYDPFICRGWSDVTSFIPGIGNLCVCFKTSYRLRLHIFGPFIIMWSFIEGKPVLRILLKKLTISLEYKLLILHRMSFVFWPRILSTSEDIDDGDGDGDGDDLLS